MTNKDIATTPERFITLERAQDYLSTPQRILWEHEGRWTSETTTMGKTTITHLSPHKMVIPPLKGKTHHARS